MNEMTYYWENDVFGSKVVARSYITQHGIIFDEGVIFDSKDPVSGVNDFFVERHHVCDSIKELNYETSRLKRKYGTIIKTKEMYR